MALVASIPGRIYLFSKGRAGVEAIVASLLCAAIIRELYLYKDIFGYDELADAAL